MNSREDLNVEDELLIFHENETTQRKHHREWVLGWICIFLIVIIWVAASFVVQNIESTFHAPFFLTFCCTNMFVLFFPIAYLGAKWKNVRAPTSSMWGISFTENRRLRSSGLRLAPLWFSANFLYIASLGRTSVTSSTILSSTSSVFTLLLGYLVHVEPIGGYKIIGVVLCFIGAIFVGFSDRKAEDEDDSLLGDMLSLASAALYACYSIYLSQVSSHSLNTRMDLLLAYVGMWNAILCTPIVIFLHITGIESLSALTWPIFSQIVLKGFFDNVLADFLWAWAVVLTSPTTTTVGLSLTIPLSAIIDYFFKQHVPSSFTLIGAGFVLMSFLCVYKEPIKSD